MNTLERAIELVGGQSALSKELGVSQGLISQWVTGRRPLPALHCPAIEAATGGAVRVDELRPDVVWQRDPKTGAVTGYLVEVSRAA